jgi:hypothetical protein
MTVSGTVSTTVFNTNNILDMAFRRCKIAPEIVTSEMQQTALDSLYLMVSSLCNQGIQLWTVEKIIMPFYLGNGYIELPAGTIDLLNQNYRTISRYTGTTSSSQGIADFAEDNDLATSCTQTTANGYILVNLLAQQNISTLGINMASAGAYDITVSYSNDNSTYTTVLTPGSVTYGAGEWHWYDINPSINAQYWKLQAINGTILDVAEFVVSGNPTEIPLARLNQDDYTNLPNKTFQGRPLQFWLDRQLAAPVMRLWPAPNQQAEFAQMVAWRQRHIMDVGSLTETIEVPQRWVDAIAWYLAYRLCFEIQQVDISMANILKPIADERMALAFGEERDNSPFQMYPNISPYTR